VRLFLYTNVINVINTVQHADRTPNMCFKICVIIPTEYVGVLVIVAQELMGKKKK
jgi:hypothetical protein